MPNTFAKDPSAILDYTVSWVDWLAAGDTIASHTVTVPTGITKVSSANTTTAVTMWLSGGTAGAWYEVLCQIVTALGRTDERTIHVQVVNR